MDVDRREPAGLHIMMDAYVTDPAVFTRERLEQLFAKLIAALEMKALDRAVFYEVEVDPTVLERVKLTGKFEDSGGISSFQVISTSHMSLHAWPLESFFSLDCFSCATYNSQLALSLIREVLGVYAEETQVVDRWKPRRYPSPIMAR